MRSLPRISLLAALSYLLLAASSTLAFSAERVFIGGTWYPLTTSRDHLLLSTQDGVDAATLNDSLKRAGLDTALTQVRKAPQYARALVSYAPGRKSARPDLARFAALAELSQVRYAPLLNGAPLFLSGELLAKLAPGADPQAVRELLTRHGLRIKTAGFLFADRFLLVNPDPTRSEIDLANDLMAYPGLFAWVEVSLIRDMKPRFVPNDPYYKNQWHLNNTGSWLGKSGGTPGADIAAEQAWDLTRGDAATIIAVVDDGVEMKHPDLKAKMVAGRDFVSNDNDSTPPAGGGNEGPWGHGTCVAGAAAAIGNNGVGVSGSCPDCGLIGVRLLNDEGTSTATIAAAFQWACDSGAAVINNSWGPGSAKDDFLDYGTQGGIDYCVQHGRKGLGTVFVWAAGNEHRELTAGQLEAYSEIMTIGASNPDDTFCTYSNYGAFLAVVAPSGGDRYDRDNPGQWDWYTVTTDVSGSNGYSSGGYSQLGYGREMESSGNYTKFFNGTSAAAPVAAGVVGLVLSANPNLSYRQAITLISQSADKTPRANLYDTRGFNAHYGYGRINAYKAVQLAQIGDCGDITAKGRCWGQTAQWCEGGKLTTDSCNAAAKILCSENAEGNFRCAQCVESAKSCGDKRDNDCDGSVDEADECATGECLPGTKPPCEGLAHMICGADAKPKRDLNCDDYNPCTVDACKRYSGCTNDYVQDGTACGDGGTCTNGACSVVVPIDGDKPDGDTSEAEATDNDTEPVGCAGECAPGAAARCLPDGLCECLALTWTLKDCLFSCIQQGKGEGSCAYDPLHDTMACKCTQAAPDGDLDGVIPTPHGATGGGGCSQGTSGLGGFLGLLLWALYGARRRTT